MYQDFFDMTAQPFTQIPDFYFYADSSNEKTFGNLASGMARGEGFIVISGAPGTGKSSLATLLAGQYQTELFHVAHVAAKKSGPEDLLRLIATKLGLNSAGDTNADLFRDIGIYLARIGAHGGRGIFIIDDAQNLSHKSLEMLRVLAGHKVGKKPLVQILLFGRRELLFTLNKEEFSGLRKVIVARIYLHPFSPEETQAYILHRLQHAEWKDDPHLTLEALRQIHAYTGGIPGRINRICDHLLKSAFRDQNHVIDGAYTDAIVSRLMRNQTPKPAGTPSLPLLPPVPPPKKRDNTDFESELGLVAGKIRDPAPYQRMMRAALNRVRPDNTPPILTPLNDDPELTALSEDRPVRVGKSRRPVRRADLSWLPTLISTLDALNNKVMQQIIRLVILANDKIVSVYKRGRMRTYTIVALSVVGALGALTFLIGNLLSEGTLVPDTAVDTNHRNGNANQPHSPEIDTMTARIYKSLIQAKKMEFAEDLTIEDIVSSTHNGAKPATANSTRTSVIRREPAPESRPKPAPTQPLSSITGARSAPAPGAVLSEPAQTRGAPPVSGPDTAGSGQITDNAPALNATPVTTPESASSPHYPISAMLPFDLLPGVNVFDDDSIWSLAEERPAPITRFHKPAGTTTFALSRPVVALAEPVSTFNPATEPLAETAVAPAIGADTGAVNTPDTGVATATQVATSPNEAPVDKRELDILVSKFLRFYETGNLDQYLRLFSADVRTESYRGINTLRQEYERFFASTTQRSLDFKGVGWSWENTKAIGSGDIISTTQGSDAQSAIATQGKIRMVVGRGKEGIEIEELVQDFNP